MKCIFHSSFHTRLLNLKCLDIVVVHSPIRSFLVLKTSGRQQTIGSWISKILGRIQNSDIVSQFFNLWCGSGPTKYLRSLLDSWIYKHWGSSKPPSGKLQMKPWNVSQGLMHYRQLNLWFESQFYFSAAGNQIQISSLQGIYITNESHPWSPFDYLMYFSLFIWLLVLLRAVSTIGLVLKMERKWWINGGVYHFAINNGYLYYCLSCPCVF